MKKKIISQAAIICLFLLSFPVIAKADFFESPPWYMDSSWWEEITAWDPQDRGTLIDNSSNRLNWITTSTSYPTGWTDGYDAFRAYGSKWVFELKDDFEFAVKFHYDHTGTYKWDGGDIETGLVWFDDPTATEPSHVFSISAGNQYWNSNINKFSSYTVTPEAETNSWWRRTNTDGMLYARYNSSEDELQFQALEGSYPSWEAVGGSEYYGLKTKMDLTQLRLYFGGWSEGAGLASGDAYLENFVVHKGTITPEPVGSILFVVGGASLVAFRYYKRKRGIVL